MTIFEDDKHDIILMDVCVEYLRQKLISCLSCNDLYSVNIIHRRSATNHLGNSLKFISVFLHPTPGGRRAMSSRGTWFRFSWNFFVKILFFWWHFDICQNDLMARFLKIPSWCILKVADTRHVLSMNFSIRLFLVYLTSFHGLHNIISQHNGKYKIVTITHLLFDISAADRSIWSRHIDPISPSRHRGSKVSNKISKLRFCGNHLISNTIKGIDSNYGIALGRRGFLASNQIIFSLGNILNLQRMYFCSFKSFSSWEAWEDARPFLFQWYFLHWLGSPSPKTLDIQK